MTAQIYFVDFRSYAQRLREQIIATYAPFGAEFSEGLRDYEVFATGGELLSNPHRYGSVAATEWDRGFKAGMHIRSATAPPTCQGWNP